MFFCSFLPHMTCSCPGPPPRPSAPQCHIPYEENEVMMIRSAIQCFWDPGPPPEPPPIYTLRWRSADSRCNVLAGRSPVIMTLPCCYCYWSTIELLSCFCCHLCFCSLLSLLFSLCVPSTISCPPPLFSSPLLSSHSLHCLPVRRRLRRLGGVIQVRIFRGTRCPATVSSVCGCGRRTSMVLPPL